MSHLPSGYYVMGALGALIIAYFIMFVWPKTDPLPTFVGTALLFCLYHVLGNVYRPDIIGLQLVILVTFYPSMMSAKYVIERRDLRMQRVELASYRQEAVERLQARDQRLEQRDRDREKVQT